MNERKPNSLLPLGFLATALLLWAGMFAAGAYFEVGTDQPRHDLRKPVIVMACMGGFLAFWGMALWLRARRRPK